MNTKKVVLALLVVFASISLLSKLCSASEPDNGNWWRTLPYSDRVFYVSGLFDGPNVLVDYTINTVGLKDKKYALTMKVIAISNHLTSDVGRDTIGQIVDGLNRFYNDFRNRKILVCDAFLVVIKEINGDSKSEINKQIMKDRRLYK